MNQRKDFPIFKCVGKALYGASIANKTQQKQPIINGCKVFNKSPLGVRVRDFFERRNAAPVIS